MDLVETATRQRETGRDRQRPLRIRTERPCGLLLERPGCAGELGDAERPGAKATVEASPPGGCSTSRDGIQRCISVSTTAQWGIW